MNKYKVRVEAEEIGDEGDEPPFKDYIVDASTEDDACQLAFALDGGYNSEELDVSGQLALVKTYATVIEILSFSTLDCG